jgi:hypothetical protein
MNKTKHLVYVKPIIKERWHNLHLQGRSRFADTYDTLQPVYSSALGHLATGLDDGDAERLGQQLGVNLSPSVSNEYWTDFKIKMHDKTMIFDINAPLDEVRIAVLKASKYIANSQKELENGKWPEANYIIFDEEQEIQSEAKKVEVKAKAVTEFNKLSPGKRLDILKIFGKTGTNNSADFTYTKLYEILEDDPKEFLRVSTMKKSDITIRALIFDLERIGIFRKRQTAYLYNDSQIGFDYDDTVQNLLNPKNQELLIKLKSDLESRTHDGARNAL